MRPSYVIVLVALAVAASVAVWASAIVRWSRGEPVLPIREPRRPARPAWSPVAVALTLGLLGVNLAGRLGIIGEVDPTRVPSVETIQQTCLFHAGIVGVLLIVLGHTTDRGLLDFGIRFEGWRMQLAIGVLTFVASIAPVLAVLMAMLPWRDPEKMHPLLQLLARDERPIVLLWVGLAAVATAPLVEELMYRVVLQGAGERFLPAPAAIVGVAIVFSAVHNPIDVLPLVPLALILGYVYHRTRSYVAVVTAHGLFNLAMLLLMLATRNAQAP